jgi:hypothetical protein
LIHNTKFPIYSTIRPYDLSDPQHDLYLAERYERAEEEQRNDPRSMRINALLGIVGVGEGIEGVATALVDVHDVRPIFGRSGRKGV